MPRYRVVITRTEYLRGEIEVETDEDLDPANEEDRELLEELSGEVESPDDFECVNADETVESVTRLEDKP